MRAADTVAVFEYIQHWVQRLTWTMLRPIRLRVCCSNGAYSGRYNRFEACQSVLCPASCCTVQTASAHRTCEWLNSLTKHIRCGEDVRLCKEALVFLYCVSSQVAGACEAADQLAGCLGSGPGCCLCQQYCFQMSCSGNKV